MERESCLAEDSSRYGDRRLRAQVNLRGVSGIGREAPAASLGRTQGPENVLVDRQAYKAPGYRSKSERRRQVRLGHQAAGNADGGGRARSHLRRHRQEL